MNRTMAVLDDVYGRSGLPFGVTEEVDGATPKDAPGVIRTSAVTVFGFMVTPAKKNIQMIRMDGSPSMIAFK